MDNPDYQVIFDSEDLSLGVYYKDRLLGFATNFGEAVAMMQENEGNV